MDEGLRRQALEWFERGNHDIESAQLLLEQYGHTDTIGCHIQQAIEKYLKGFLVLRGERPPRIHELDTLLNLVDRFEPNLYEPFIELCERATRYDVEERYPPGPPAVHSRQIIRADLDSAWQLIGLIRQEAGLPPNQ